MHNHFNEQGDWDVMKVNELLLCVSSLILNLPPLNANVDSPIWNGLVIEGSLPLVPTGSFLVT